MLSVKKEHSLAGDWDSRGGTAVDVRSCDHCPASKGAHSGAILGKGTKLKSTNHERILLTMQRPHVLQPGA
jgi:hypothetical protein